jgi:hypothetical protein
VSRCEPTADESGGSIVDELTTVIGGNLDHVALVQNVVVGRDDRAAQHPHPPELKPRKPRPGKMSSACALRVEASGCRGHELKFTAPGLPLSSSEIAPAPARSATPALGRECCSRPGCGSLVDSAALVTVGQLGMGFGIGGRRGELA